jgi:hypothetical protein
MVGVGLVAVALLLTGALFLLFPRSSRVTKAAFDQIEVGMSRPEVEAILGGPPGDYTTMPVQPDLRSPGGLVECLYWEGDEGTIEVTVDADGAISWKGFCEARPEKVGLFGLLWWRFQRWRDRVFGAGP